MGKRTTFTQAEVTRAVKGVLAAGLPVHRVEFIDGRPVVICSGNATAESNAAVEDWFAKDGDAH